MGYRSRFSPSLRLRIYTDPCYLEFYRDKNLYLNFDLRTPSLSNPRLSLDLRTPSLSRIHVLASISATPSPSRIYTLASISVHRAFRVSIPATRPAVTSYFFSSPFLHWFCSFATSHLALETSASGEGCSKEGGSEDCKDEDL
jgi:hypothetical protein